MKKLSLFTIAFLLGYLTHVFIESKIVKLYNPNNGLELDFYH